MNHGEDVLQLLGGNRGAAGEVSIREARIFVSRNGLKREAAVLCAHFHLLRDLIAAFGTDRLAGRAKGNGYFRGREALDQILNLP